MAEQMGGYRFWELGFDENGRPRDAAALDTFVKESADPAITDLFIFSHGWNNDRDTARNLYDRFFGQLAAVEALLGQSGIPRRRAATIATAGVIWPSIRWPDEQTPGRAGGAASMDDEASAGAAIPDAQLIRGLKDVFTTAPQQAALEEMAGLLDRKSDNIDDLKQFGELMKTAFPPPAASSNPAGPAASIAPEDNGEAAGLLDDDPLKTFKRMSAVAPPQRASDAAGLGDAFGKLWSGAKEAARAATYWQMKNRAGVVAQNGLAPLLGRVAGSGRPLNVHLVGHSFGARLVSFTVGAIPPAPAGGAGPIKTLFLVQGAFSHYAFADQLPQDSARSGALKGMAAKVGGPLVVTHSRFDLALGTAYPLASLAARQDAAGADELLERWWAMGHRGAHAVNPAAFELTMSQIGTNYAFERGRFTNLDANSVIKTGGPPSGAHSDIVHPEIAWALLAAAGIGGS
jgi:hypothetical protein